VAPALIAVAALVAIAAAVGGFVAGNSGSSSGGAPANNSSASAGPLTVTHPDSWQRQGSPPPIPGYAFKEPIALAPKSGGSAAGSLTAGTVNANNASLLPAAFQKALGGRASKPDAVKLGDLQAYRYSNLKPQGAQTAYTIYAVPTTAGVATIACSGQSPSFTQECERVASTLTLTGATPFQLGVPAAYANGLNAALTKLQGQRGAALAKLKAAKKPGPQAAAARQAAAAYGAAARTHPSTVPPQVGAADAAILAALRAGQRAYTALAVAAASGNSGKYAAAQGQIRRADGALQKALQLLQSSPQ
jgi:hypothetical protein